MTNHKGLLKSYIIGFLLSVVFTLCAYYPVMLHVNSHHLFPTHEIIIPIIMILAFAQLIVQLLFFLHLGRESQPRWNLIMLISFVSVIFIMVVGSLWIMNHLNYNMSPMQMQNFLIKDEGIYK